VPGGTLRRWYIEAEGGDTQPTRPARTNVDAAPSGSARLERDNRELRRANEILKSASAFRGGARPPTEEVVAFVTAHRDRFLVEPILRTLEVAPSTYYCAVSRARRVSGRSVTPSSTSTSPGRSRTPTASTAPARCGASSTGRAFLSPAARWNA